MTWKQLADFINNQMPECNKNQKVMVWDSKSGQFCYAHDVSPFDIDECANDNNFYSIDLCTEWDDWFM